MTPNNSPFKIGDRVVAYCRYSGGEEQGLKDTSTDEQEAAIRRYCDDHGLDLVKVYADPFVSGRSTKGRDHYLEMMSDLLHAKRKKTGIEGLIAWDFERVHRNYDQAQLDAARLRMAGYKIYSLQQPIIDNGPFAHVLEAMYFASAQNQSDMISADVKRALQHNFVTHKVIPRSCIPNGWIAVPVDMGVYSNGEPRIGYKAEPDPDMVEPIRQAVEARIAGAPIREVKHLLGQRFAQHPEKVEKLMQKPLLYGSLTYGGTTIEDYCTPIIDRATFDRLQVANSAWKAKVRRPGSGAYSKDRAMLSGLCFCGVCGERAYINRRTAKGRVYESYYCNGKHAGFRKELLEDLILNAAEDLLTGEKYETAKAELMRSMVREQAQKEQDAEAIRQQIAVIDRKIDGLTEAIADNPHSHALALKLADLEAKRENLSAGMKSPAEAQFGAFGDVLDSLRDNTLSVLKDEKSGADDLRTALSLFVSAITLYPNGEVVIRHTVPGLAGVESELSGTPTAPPEGDAIYSQTRLRVIR